MLLLLLACTATPEDTAVDLPTLAPPSPAEGFQLSMTGVTVEPYSEVWICDVYPMPADELAPVNWVEYLQTPDTHHMTVSTPTLLGGQGTIPEGRYDCNALYEESTLMDEATMFFGNQGEAQGEMHLPDGVAAQMPPNIDILHELHYVNPTDEPVELYSYLNAYTINDSQVEEGIWGGSVRDETIEIPADSTHSEWSRCVMNTDVDVLFLASHMHEAGVSFTIAPFDGETVGDVFYENDDWHDPKITQYDPPLIVPTGEGFEFTCTWDNRGAEPILYGPTSKDEMCNMTLVHTPFDLNALCEVVETSDGVLWSP